MKVALATSKQRRHQVLIACFGPANLSMLKPPFQSTSFNVQIPICEKSGAQKTVPEVPKRSLLLSFRLARDPIEANCSRSAIVTPFTVAALAGSALSARAAMHSRRSSTEESKSFTAALAFAARVPLLIPRRPAVQPSPAFLRFGASVSASLVPRRAVRLQHSRRRRERETKFDFNLRQHALESSNRNHDVTGGCGDRQSRRGKPWK